MKKYLILCPFLISTVTSCVTSQSREPQSESSFHLSMIRFDTQVEPVNIVELRTGLFMESQESSFKGCVIYLEGLGDSFMNHRPYFKELSKNGYRVISFDYMGQGGSSGTMNHTRIFSQGSPGLQIGTQAKYIWQQYVNVKGANGLDCSQSKKMVIGWSTGGLAAYSLASDGWADSVVLIAPGLNPNYFVGESAQSPSLLLSSSKVITERTLTRNKFEGQANPHIDPIKPNSPTAVLAFATNLLVASNTARYWKIPDQVRGLVFLSGKEDTYIDQEATRVTFFKNAYHFTIVKYEGALHELDNELPEVANDLYVKTIQFLDAASGAK